MNMLHRPRGMFEGALNRWTNTWSVLQHTSSCTNKIHERTTLWKMMLQFSGYGPMLHYIKTALLGSSSMLLQTL